MEIFHFQTLMIFFLKFKCSVYTCIIFCLQQRLYMYHRVTFGLILCLTFIQKAYFIFWIFYLNYYYFGIVVLKIHKMTSWNKYLLWTLCCDTNDMDIVTINKYNTWKILYNEEIIIIISIVWNSVNIVTQYRWGCRGRINIW